MRSKDIVPKRMPPTFQICGVRNTTTPVKYNSVPTRYASLHDFMGGAEINEVNEPVGKAPYDILPDNLEAKFKSFVNRTDMPKMWGHPNVVRKLADQVMPLANDIESYRRIGGLPLYTDQGDN